MPSARDYIDDLASRGRYHFTPVELQTALALSASATKGALRRLSLSGHVANPAHGFWVVVPPEYRRIGCLPPDQFVPDLMEQLGVSYYVGLLSAAQYHGFAHYRPQEFQVMTIRNRRPLRCGDVRVVFVAHKRLERVATQDFNTPRGLIRVSTIEATACDLVGYPKRSGGLDNVVSVLAEMAPSVDPVLLASEAMNAPLPWRQRLGYLLDLVGAEDRTGPLAEHVAKSARNYSPLTTSRNDPPIARSDKWKLLINTELDTEEIA